jgi:hypothetical protein
MCTDMADAISICGAYVYICTHMYMNVCICPASTVHTHIRHTSTIHTHTYKESLTRSHSCKNRASTAYNPRHPNLQNRENKYRTKYPHSRRNSSSRLGIVYTRMSRFHGLHMCLPGSSKPCMSKARLRHSALHCRLSLPR